MATTPVAFIAPPGLTLTGFLFTPDSDTLVNTGGDSATEESNRTGFYMMSVTEAAEGIHILFIKDSSSNLIATYFADMVDSTVQVTAKEYAIVDGIMDVYHADIDVAFNDGAATPKDEYTISWFKNGVPITSGITVPTVQVVQQSNAADLVASSTPTQVGSTGVYKHTETANRMAAGSAYIVVVTATIDGATRTWRENEGRDNVV